MTQLFDVCSVFFLSILIYISVVSLVLIMGFVLTYLIFTLYLKTNDASSHMIFYTPFLYHTTIMNP